MGIFDNHKDASVKIVIDYEKLGALASGIRAVNGKIGVTIGSWDLLHIGHVRYLMKAKSLVDVLIVGVDTDRAIKLYKGDLRPVVPEQERCEMLTYQTPVDIVTQIDDVDEKGWWQCTLIKYVRPEVFVAVEDSYPPEQIEEIKRYSREVVVLPRQAENTSTSKFVQETVKKHVLQILSHVTGEKS